MQNLTEDNEELIEQIKSILEEDELINEFKKFDAEKAATDIKYKYNLFDHDVNVTDNGDKTVILSIDNEQDTGTKTNFNLFSNVNSSTNRFGKFKFDISKDGVSRINEEIGTTLRIGRDKDKIIQKLRDKFGIGDDTRVDYEIKNDDEIELTIGNKHTTGSRQNFRLFYNTSGGLKHFGDFDFTIPPKPKQIGDFTIVGMNIQYGNEIKKLSSGEYSRIRSVLNSKTSKSKEKLENAGKAKSIEDFLRNFPDMETKKKTRQFSNIKDRIDEFSKDIIIGTFEDEGKEYPLYSFKTLKGVFIYIPEKMGYERVNWSNLEEFEDKKYRLKERKEKITFNKTRKLEFDELMGVLDKEYKNDKISDKRWRLKEKEIQKKLNNILSDKKGEIFTIDGNPVKDTYSAEPGGGGQYSDILILKNKEKQFYIESKLNFSSGEYFKFHLQLQNGRLIHYADTKLSEDKQTRLNEIFGVDSKEQTESLLGILASKDNEIKKQIDQFYDNITKFLTQTSKWINEKSQFRFLKESFFKDSIPLYTDKSEIKKNMTFPIDLKPLVQCFDKYLKFIIAVDEDEKKTNELTKYDKYESKNITQFASQLKDNLNSLPILNVDDFLSEYSKINDTKKALMSIYTNIISSTYKKGSDSIKTLRLFYTDAKDILPQITNKINQYYSDVHSCRYLEIGINPFKNKTPYNSQTWKSLIFALENSNKSMNSTGYDPLQLKRQFGDDKIHDISALNELNAQIYAQVSDNLDEFKFKFFIGDKKYEDGLVTSGMETISFEDIKELHLISNSNEKNKTIKTNEDQQELREEINRVLNESSIEDNDCLSEYELEEGIATSETESNKYELQVTDALREFLQSQKPPYNTLKVEHYEESDKKYWSDIKVTNTKTNKRFWVEAKEDKYACLGSSSFKYINGEWSCTTLEENNPLSRFMLKSLEENSHEFIQFCKDFLGTDDIRLPGDLTDELVQEWKRGRNIDDTENDVLFITDKIQVEDFGSMVASFYKYAKNEPAYYIHVGDVMYLVDSDTNILGLITKDGRKLKTLSEAYRKGRIQFRIKTYDRPQKMYYSIYCDAKILSDKENDDEEYNCSLLIKENWPVIYQPGNEDMLDESESKDVKFGLIIKNTDNNFLDNILSGKKTIETRYETPIKRLINKIGSVEDIIGSRIALINDKKEIVGLATIKDIIKYESKEEFADDYEKHLVNPDDPTYGWKDGTVKYGIELGDVSTEGFPKKINYTDRFQNQYDRLNGFLSNVELLNVDEAEQDIGGEKSQDADKFSGLKIWIDDIREAPEGFRWFHSVREFIDYVDAHGTEDIELIDTDHDAGDYQKFGGDYIRCFDYLDFIGAKNITIHIHSANPVGANNIRRIISRNKEENGWKEIRNSQN